MERKKYKITVDTAGTAYFYSGYIIEEKDGFLFFHDEKDGPIELNMDHVISKKKIDGGQNENE